MLVLKEYLEFGLWRIKRSLLRCTRRDRVKVSGTKPVCILICSKRLMNYFLLECTENKGISKVIAAAIEVHKIPNKKIMVMSSKIST